MNKEKHNIGKWKLGDEINETFINLDMYDNKDWETPPTLNFESTVTLYYPDGKVITNPTSEEVLEWATIVDATIPQLDTSSVTTMYSMFEGCTNFTAIPPLDVSNVEKDTQIPVHHMENESTK